MAENPPVEWPSDLVEAAGAWLTATDSAISVLEANTIDPNLALEALDEQALRLDTFRGRLRSFQRERARHPAS